MGYNIQDKDDQWLEAVVQGAFEKSFFKSPENFSWKHPSWTPSYIKGLAYSFTALMMNGLYTDFLLKIFDSSCCLKHLYFYDKVFFHIQ